MFLFVRPLRQSMARPASRRISLDHLSSNWSSRTSLPKRHRMTIVLTLLIVSAMLGLATGLVFRVGAIALVSALIAILSAVALRADGFGFAGAVPVMIGCLVISQIAYLAGAFIISRSDNAGSLTQEEVDGRPNNPGEQNVSDDDI